MKTLNFFLIFLFATGLSLQAQVIDSTPVAISEKNMKTEEFHSPKKAAMYSAILPGLGQAYNKKYWKMPLVYAGFGALGYFTVWNNNQFNITRTAYVHLKDRGDKIAAGEEPDPNKNGYMKIKGIEFWDLDNPNDISTLKNAFVKWQAYYRRNRDLLVIGTVAFYALQIIDANVDAHLFNFDIGDDLSMNWQPSMLNVDNKLGYAINLSFKF